MNNQDLEKAKEVLKGKHIFIAYIEEDKKVAELIWDKLNELGAIPWAYTKNFNNTMWREEIVSAIENSDAIVLVFSKKTDEVADRHIVREISLASNKKKIVIPFMLDDIEEIKNKALAYELVGINWVRKTNPIDRQIDLLLIRLVKYFGGTVPLPEPVSRTPKLLVLGFLSFIILGVIGYFMKPYIYNTKQSKLYVCYDSKNSIEGNISYIGCKQYNKSCKSNNKEYFGHYDTIKEVQKALTECKDTKTIKAIINKTNIKASIGNKVAKKSADKNISKIDIKNLATEMSLPKKQNKLYVCYDSKKNINGNPVYKGCKKYSNSCKSNNKGHFGKYVTKKETQEAFLRCVNSKPKNTQVKKIQKNISNTISYNTNKIFDYKKDTLPNKIVFNPKHPENFIFFAKDRRSLSILRNLPYAIKGYDYKTEEIANFYNKMPWYKPNPNAKHLKRNPLEEKWWDSVKEFKLIILKNLPYAFKGAVFKDKRLNIYFSQFKWYKPNKNYTPSLSSLSEEDKEWINEIKSKDPKKYVGFFNLLDVYLSKKLN